MPAIVVAELFYGAEHSANPERELGIVEEFVNTFETVPFDGASARRYGSLRQLLGSQGMFMGDRDLMVASCALANDATLVTRNVKEFVRVPNLRIVSWGETELD